MKTIYNDVEDEAPRSDCNLSIDKDQAILVNNSCSQLVDGSILNQVTTFEIGVQPMPEIICDHAAVMKELANLRAEIYDIKHKCFTKAGSGNEEETEQLRNDLVHCHWEIKELITERKIQNEHTKRLEEEKASLVTAIKLLVHDNAQEADTPKGNDDKNALNVDAEQSNTKKNKNKKLSKAKENINSQQNDDTDADDSGSEGATEKCSQFV